MERKIETDEVARVESDDFAKIFNLASMFVVILAVGHMFSTQLHVSPPQPQSKLLGPRILLGDEDTLENKAKAYQEVHGLAKSSGYYSHFAQQVGESYTAYYNGKPFTPEEKTAVDHAFCATGKPHSRYYHTSTLVPHSGNASNLFGNLPLKSLMFIFGGRRAQALNDGWVFVNGVIDGKQWGEGANASKRIHNPLSGKSCNECPDYITTACKGKALSCNACNQWHKARLSIRTRTSVECDVFHTWCPTTDVNYHYRKINSSEKVYRSEHATAFVYKDVEHAGQGTMFMHGGQGATIGATRTLWYLNRMPIPTSGIDKTAQYEAEMTAEWRCAKVYGNLESSDSYQTSLFRSYNAGCEANTPDRRTAMSGIIDSGVPRPQHRCSWIVQPPPNGKHTIAFEFTRLDLSESDAYVCENWIMLEEVWYSNETDYILHLIKTSPTSASGDDGSHTKKKLLHGSLVENRKTLARACSIQQLENNYVTTSHVNASMHITLKYDSFCPANSGVGGNYTIIPDGDPMLLCPRTCPTILPCLTTCNNQGTCKGGRCHCKQGFYGTQCERRCIRKEGCGSIRGAVDDFYPSPRLSHSLLATYRHSVSRVVNVTETGEHPTNNCVVTKEHLPPIMDGNDELGEKYAFVRTNVSSIVYTMSGGGKTKVVTMTESISTTEGFTRLILFGGWSDLVVSDELWTLDVQDQLEDTYDSENCPSFEGLSNCTNFNLTLCHGKGFSDSRRHPQFPTLPRWNKWSIPVLSGSERPKGRFGHSAVMSGRYRTGQKTLLRKDQLGDRMVIFGGQGQTNVMNDVWELNVPQAPGQVWEWKSLNFSMPRISTFYFPGDGLVRVTLEEAGIELDGTINVVESPLKIITGKWRITKQIDPYTIEFNVTEKRNQEAHSIGPVRAMSLPIGKRLHGGKISTKSFPLPRRHAASSMFKNKTIGMEVLVVYGGFDGMVGLDDVWVLNVNEEDSTKYAWFRILEGVSDRGAWAAAIGWKPFWFLGVRMQEESSEKVSSRYGHTMLTMTSSVDGSGDSTDVFLAYGGMGTRRISTEMNIDHYGFVWGGKNGDMVYVCPSVDMACAHSTFKGTAFQALPKQPLIGFLVTVQIFYFVVLW